jgi:hypothetical protein
MKVVLDGMYCHNLRCVLLLLLALLLLLLPCLQTKTSAAAPHFTKCVSTGTDSYCLPWAVWA